MNESQLDDLIRKLHAQPLEPLETPECPRFAELWAFEAAKGAPPLPGTAERGVAGSGGGLNSRSLSTHHVESCARCQRVLAIIRREHAQPKPMARPLELLVHGSKLVTRSWLIRGGLAASLLLVLLLTLLIHTGEPVLAEDEIQAINRTFIFDGPFPDLEVLANPDEVTRRLVAILAASQKLGEWKEVAAREPEREEDGYYPAGEAMHAWTHVYRGLRDLGRWDLAFDEMRKAMDYTRNTPSPSRTSLPDWHPVVLHDLGETCAMMGDFDAAREWYRQSIEARMAEYGRPDRPDLPRPGRESGYASSLAPLYWRLTDIALIENDLEEARHSLAEAERPLRDYFVAFAAAVEKGSDPLGGVVGAAAGNALADGSDLRGLTPAGLLEVYHALPAEFRNAPDPLLPDEERQPAFDRYGIHRPEASQVVKVREHLLRVARLRRAEGDLAAARAVLDEAAAIPYYAFADESRLDFAEPLERARIAIAERDYAASLDHLHEAAAHTGPIIFGGDKNADKPPISPMLRAQLQVLRGLALLGGNPSDAQGRSSVENSWAVVGRLAKGMEPKERDRFMQQFEPWKRLITEAGK